MEKHIEIKELDFLGIFKSATILFALMFLIGGYVILVSSLILHGVGYVFHISVGLLVGVLLVSPLLGAILMIVSILYNYLSMKIGGFSFTVSIRDK